MQYRHIRTTRVIVALALVGIVAVTSWSYLKRLGRWRSNTPAVPSILPGNVENATVGFNYTKIESGQPVFSIKAYRNLGLKGNKNILEEVEVLVHGRGGDRYDRIHSARADYDQEAGTVFFEGDVTILLSSKNQEANANRLGENDPQRALFNKTQIKTSKVIYWQRSSRVETPAPVQFTFNELSGSAVGMHYDASRDQLSLDREVRVRLERNDGAPPVEISSGSLNFKKNSREVAFTPNVQIRRGESTLEAQEVMIHLDANNRVESALARGNPSLKSPASGAQLTLTANAITAKLSLGGKSLENIVAEDNVQGEARSSTSTTALTAQRLTASFAGVNNELRQLVGENNVVLKIFPPAATASKEASHPGSKDNLFSLAQSNDVKVLYSSRVEITLGKGGRDFERLACPVPSTLELIPPIVTQDRKIVKGDRFDGTFVGQKNTLETFRASGHVTVDLEPQSPQPSSTHRKTQSDLFVARFDPSTGLLTSIDQSGNFQFFETDLISREKKGGLLRRATAAKAHYAAVDKVTTLEGQPQIWDASSKTTAQSMTLDELSDKMTATGDVLTLYQEKKSSVTPFSGSDAPVFVSADRLEGHSQGRSVVYSGKARLWQEDNVVRADEIQLDKKSKTLLANRHVVSTFLAAESGDGKKNFVSVAADSLKYEDVKQRARYENHVIMKGEMGVLEAPLLDIYLVEKPKPHEERIDHAIAQGGVSIVQPLRRAKSERAEFFPRDSKVILSGNQPTIFDEEKGASTGRELTFFTRDDRILVEGDHQSRATTQHKVARQ